MNANNLPGSWIYVLISSQDYTRCKIGRTGGNPLIRYRHLRTADPFLGLVVAYYIPNFVGSVSSLEASIHNQFQDQRIDNHDEGKTEWFRIEYSQVEMLIDGMLENWCNQKVHYFSGLHPDKLCKLYESDIQACFEADPCDVEFARWLLNGPSG
jgi:hypothetical protein